MTLVTLTRSAKNQLLQLMRANKTNAALFRVEGGGCNGLKYILEADHNPKAEKHDEVVYLDTTEQQLRVCGKSLLHLIGTEIDWQSDFMGNSFRFSNPNEAASCGCGATFTPIQDD